ncbi:hypothetical protein DACRYDRAFT_50938, partial [Dacryopinax primogenitus]
CKASFKAANPEQRWQNSSQYCVHGIVAIVCCHDIPLYLTNLIDTGEKHFYTVTLMQKVMDQLPAAATVSVLYNIACQAHRSVNKHGLMPKLQGQITWATSVLHAYGHQWACQLHFHP